MKTEYFDMAVTPQEEKEQARNLPFVPGSCRCGEKLEVDPAWIGEVFTCLVCGAKIGVTKYGLIKRVK